MEKKSNGFESEPSEDFFYRKKEFSPFGVETTSPFLYLCGVAGSDRGDVGIDLGRPSMAVGSMLDVLARDCDVLERFKRAL